MSAYETISLVVQLVIAFTGVVALCYNIFKRK